MNSLLETIQLPTQKDQVRNVILNVESEIRNLPGAMFDDCFPLKHSFAGGMYIREITVPKGMLIVTKIHKHDHPYFLLKGDCSVLTETGVVRIKAPYSGITLAGTKRVVYTHEDVIWTTIHKTDETDLVKIEEELIAKNFDELNIDDINIDELNIDELNIDDINIEALKKEIPCLS